MKRQITIVVAVAAALTLQIATPASAATTRARGAGELRDLQTATEQPTDHATAQVVAAEHDGSTTISLKVQGLDHGAARDLQWEEENAYGKEQCNYDDGWESRIFK